MRMQSLGSDVFETSVIKTDEYIELIKSALPNNGDDLTEAEQDVRMLDSMLGAQRLYVLQSHNIRYTATGRIRKSSSICDLYMTIVEGRMKNLL